MDTPKVRSGLGKSYCPGSQGVAGNVAYSKKCARMLSIPTTRYVGTSRAYILLNLRALSNCDCKKNRRNL